MSIPDPVPKTPPRRPHSLVRSLLGWTLTALLVALVAGIAVVPWLASSPERITELVAVALPEIHADVKPGRVAVGWFGPIVLEDLKVVPRSGEEPPITIRRVEVSHGLGGILLTLGDLGRVRVEGLEANVVFDREHRANLDAILPPPDPAVDAPAKVRGGPRRAALRVRIEVEDAIVRVGGPWASKPWVSDPIDIRATLTNNADGIGEWSLEPVQLLTQAELEENVAHEVLAYIVPVFADATRTSGRFSLRIDGARLPVGKPADGELSGMLSMHEVVLGPGPLVENVFRAVPALPPPPTIRIADESNVTFQLAEGRVWHEGLEFGVPLVKPGQRLDVRSEGSVGLEDRSLDLVLTLPIPADLPQDRPLVAALAGKQISLGVGGDLDKPEVKFDGSIKAAAGHVLVDFLDRLRDGPRPPASVPSPAPGLDASPPLPAAASNPEAAGAPAPPRPGWAPPGVSPPASSPEPRPETQASGTSSPREKVEAMATEAASKAGAEPGTAEVIVDIVGGVLDEVARRRAERRAAEAANPGQTPPPRRGRLLQRRPPPPASEAPATTPGAPAPAPAP
jgi:hypothetical protein